jgi:CRP/FNR family transcriptional regulator, cyclic AMP receptor protein
MRSFSSPYELLAKVWLFSELGRSELEALSRRGSCRRWDAGAIVVRQGDADRDLYVVADGLLQASVRAADGREIVLNLLRGSDVFGEVTLFDGLVRSATVTTLKRSELFILPREELLHTIRQSPDIALKLLSSMAGLVRKLTVRSEDLSVLSVHARLCKKLLEIAEICGTPIAPNQVALPASLSQQDLANHVQATRESVNKSIARLIRVNILHRTHTQILILDKDALQVTSTASGLTSRGEGSDRRASTERKLRGA